MSDCVKGENPRGKAASPCVVARTLLGFLLADSCTHSASMGVERISPALSDLPSVLGIGRTLSRETCEMS